MTVCIYVYQIIILYNNNIDIKKKVQLVNYQKLISMGFDDQLSWIASQKFIEIDKCIEFILKENQIHNKNIKTSSKAKIKAKI